MQASKHALLVSQPVRRFIDTQGEAEQAFEIVFFQSVIPSIDAFADLCKHWKGGKSNCLGKPLTLQRCQHSAHYSLKCNLPTQ